LLLSYQLNENIIHQFYWWVPAMLSR